MPNNPGFIKAPDQQVYPWVEIQNNQNIAIDLVKYAVVFKNEAGEWPFTFTPLELQPGEIVVLWITAGNQQITETGNIYIPFPSFIGNEQVYLKLNESQVWVDSLTYNLTLSQGETIGKLAITGETPFIYNGELASPNEVNIVKPNWRKTNNYATFPAADSEPNACVTYKDKIWIFGGWGYNPGTENYGSHSYIWTSPDGNDWTMVNDSLPFTHYSGFIVFKDSMRVYTNYQIYSSVDGVNWIGEKPVPYEFFGENVRLTVKGDTLFFIDGQMCGYSVDGLNFVLATHNIPPRRYAALKATKDHLYYFGGQKARDTLAYFNDVWKSADGIAWEKITDSAAWQPRKWFMSAVLDNKLWLLGGYNHMNYYDSVRTNLNDIWYSEDGSTWKKYIHQNPWPIRHASYHTVKDGKIWLMGGFDNGELKGLYNDVWIFDNKSLFLKPGFPLANPKSWTYSPLLDSSLSISTFPQSGVTFFIRHNIDDIEIPSNLFTNNKLLVIGTGEDSIICTVKSGIPSDFPLYISSKATLSFENAPVTTNFIPMKGSTIGFKFYPQLLLPDKLYSNLEIHSSTISNLPDIKIENNLTLDKVNLPDYSVPVWIGVGGNLWLKDVNSFKSVIINGLGLGDQVIEAKDGTQLSIDRLTLNKAKGEFIIKGNFHIKEALELMQ